MTNLDILVLTTLSLVSTLYVLHLYLVPGYARFMSIIMIIVYTLPLVGFCIVVLCKVVNKMPLLEKVKHFLLAHTPNIATVRDQTNSARDLEANTELPDRIIYADAYLDTY